MPPVVELAHGKLEDLNGFLHPQPLVDEAPSVFNVGEEVAKITHEWRDEISLDQVRTEYTSQLALQAGGRDLTEGAFIYKRAYLTRDARSFNRALGIFASLLNNSADPLVAIVARAYLQLAYYRSRRLNKVTRWKLRACQHHSIGLKLKCMDSRGCAVQRSIHLGGRAVWFFGFVSPRC